jgi:hypothetical protein
MGSHGIGSAAHKATAIFRSHGLTPFRQILTPQLFARVFPARIAPKTVLIPEIIFWLMASAALSAESMAGSVQVLWATLRAARPELPPMPVSEEAFCLARRDLPLRFFLRLFYEVLAGFSRRFDQRWRWRGFRLLGLDGTEVALPRWPALRQAFPPPANQRGGLPHGQARLVGLVGLWDGLCYGFRWTSLKVSEQTSARKLIGRLLRPADLLLADRNFPDLATLAAVLARQADFLFRLPARRFAYSQLPAPSRHKQEWYVYLPLTKALRRRYPGLPANLQVRVLEYQRPGFRVSWLITSLLDTQAYPYQELVALYHQRWRQETCHREWKHTLGLSALHSHRPGGLLKEVLVQLTLSNVLRSLQAEAAPPGLAPVDLKFRETKRLVLAHVGVMTSAPAPQLPQLYRQLLAQIGRQRILVRPGRSFPRRWDTRSRNKGHGQKVMPARLPTGPSENEQPI